MAHGTRVNGASYGITGGKCLVGGTEYAIKKGRTLVGGTGYDITFGTPISEYAEGSIVYFNENGSPVEFYITEHDYESGLNGIGRTLLVRKYAYDQRQWDGSSMNQWGNCDLLSWLNSGYKSILDTNVRNLIGTTSYHYTPGNGNYTVSTRSDSIFLLSLTELGKSGRGANSEGTIVPIAGALEIAYNNGKAVPQWSRSGYTKYNNGAWGLDTNGAAGINGATGTWWSRPVFTVPSTTVVPDDKIIV